MLILDNLSNSCLSEMGKFGIIWHSLQCKLPKRALQVQKNKSYIVKRKNIKTSTRVHDTRNTHCHHVIDVPIRFCENVLTPSILQHIITESYLVIRAVISI